MSSTGVTTRSRTREKQSPVVSRRRRSPSREDIIPSKRQKKEDIYKKLDDIGKSNNYGLHSIIFYKNEEEESKEEKNNEYSGVYKVDSIIEKGKVALNKYNENSYNISNLLNNSSNNSRPIISYDDVRKLIISGNERTFPKKTEIGVCKGSITSKFFEDAFKKESKNNTFIVLMDLIKNPTVKRNQIKGFIIAKKNKMDDGSYSYYIELICSEDGYGTILLNWFINFTFQRIIKDDIFTLSIKDPSYKVRSLSLSAISSVLYYYPRFGYLHVKSCPGEENINVSNARNIVPNKKDENGNDIRNVRDTDSDEFVNFLFVLTRNGFNSYDDSFCSAIANSVSYDANNKNVLMPDFFKESNLNDFEDYTNHVKDLNQSSKDSLNRVKSLYDKTYSTYLEAKRNYDNNSSNERIETNYNNAKKNYFDAAFEYAKYLYYYASGCSGYGYKMMKCNV